MREDQNLPDDKLRPTYSHLIFSDYQNRVDEEDDEDLGQKMDDMQEKMKGKMEKMNDKVDAMAGNIEAILAKMK